jgi:hypothetical protein
MNRAILPLLLGLSLVSVICLAAEPKAEEAKAIAEIEVEKLSFREPFTLKLRVDKEHYYEENFDRKIPFVAHNKVYLFAGESFGLKLGIANGEFSTVTYQKEKKGADIEAKFKQEMQANGDAMMMLTLKSNIKQVLYLDALMTVPGEKGIHKTSILPLQPGLTGYETWPHPIVQLVLTNLRFKEETSKDASGGMPRPAERTPKPSR